MAIGKRKRSRWYLLMLVPLLSFGLSPVMAQELAEPESLPPAPATNLKAMDTPNDPGKSITITWTPSADDGGGRNDVIGYDVMRAEMPDGEFEVIKLLEPGSGQYVDKEFGGHLVENFKDYYYKIRTRAKGDSYSTVIGPVQARGQWFHSKKKVLLVGSLIFCFLVYYFIAQSKRGKELYVRPIAGIEAVDEAIGRATEMGKPILYVLGIGVASEVATIASFTILGRVAKKTAEYQSKIIVPCFDPLVMVVAQEVVKNAYSDVGRPDVYDERNIFYVTQNQFPYAAAVNGIMLREKPATNFLLGRFAAESLILAEAGNIAGAIQISGTDRVDQLPFFITACDYTLIGEELYAASAYLSKEPLQLGALKAQDWSKVAIMVFLILGAITASFGISWVVNLFSVG